MNDKAATRKRMGQKLDGSVPARNSLTAVAMRDWTAKVEALTVVSGKAASRKASAQPDKIAGE